VNESGCPYIEDIDYVEIIQKKVNCTASDSGKNFFVKGITKGYNQEGNYIEKTDYCFDIQLDRPTLNKIGTYLKEFYCEEDGSIGSEDRICSCYKGACVSKLKNIENFKLENGYYKFFINDIFTDFYVDGVKIENVQINPVGTGVGTIYKIPCKEGKQLAAYLVDSFGKVTAAFYSILQYSCEEGENITYCGDGSCNGNETCESCPQDCGECICIDSDGGENYYQPGKVTYSTDSVEGVNYDVCIDDNTLREVYCKDKQAISKYYYCEYGCVGGQCLKENEVGQSYKIIKGQTQNITFNGEEYIINASSCTPFEPPIIEITYINGRTTTAFVGKFFKEIKLYNQNVYAIVTSCPTTTDFFWMSLVGERGYCGDGICNNISIDVIIYGREITKIDIGGKSYNMIFYPSKIKYDKGVLVINNESKDVEEGKVYKIGGILRITYSKAPQRLEYDFFTYCRYYSNIRNRKKIVK